jgi:hypothetical protein
MSYSQGIGGQQLPQILGAGLQNMRLDSLTLRENVDQQIHHQEQRLSRLRTLRDLLEQNPEVEKILELTREVSL